MEEEHLDSDSDSDSDFLDSHNGEIYGATAANTEEKTFRNARIKIEQ